MSMTREDLVARNKLERPYWAAEEFIATRILRYINASGDKAYIHLKSAIGQLFPECETTTRWDTAAWLLRRRLQQYFKLDKARVIGMPEAHKGKSTLDSHIRNSGYDNIDIGGVGPNFYIFRLANTACLAGYMVWDRDLIGYIKPGFTVHPGNIYTSRVITQGLDTLLEDILFEHIAEELVI